MEDGPIKVFKITIEAKVVSGHSDERIEKALRDHFVSSLPDWLDEGRVILTQSESTDCEFIRYERKK